MTDPAIEEFRQRLIHESMLNYQTIEIGIRDQVEQAFTSLDMLTDSLDILGTMTADGEEARQINIRLGEMISAFNSVNAFREFLLEQEDNASSN